VSTGNLAAWWWILRIHHLAGSQCCCAVDRSVVQGARLVDLALLLRERENPFGGEPQTILARLLFKAT
jgi:hypothetical protein